MGKLYAPDEPLPIFKTKNWAGLGALLPALGTAAIVVFLSAAEMLKKTPSTD